MRNKEDGAKTDIYGRICYCRCPHTFILMVQIYGVLLI